MFLNKKITLIIYFLIIISLSAQHKGRRRGGDAAAFPSPVSIETHLIPSDSLFTCFITFKVAFRNLVFIKKNGNFESEISLAIEVINDDEIVDRVIKKSNALADKYELTKSDKYFLQDVTSIILPKGNYIFNPVVSIENTDIEVKLRPLDITVDSTELSYPIAVHKNKTTFNNKDVYLLANSENSIPYSLEEFDLLIPVFDQSINSIDVEIFQRGKVLLNESISKYDKLNMKLNSYDGKIIIDYDEKYPQVKLFKIKYVNEKLDEGMAKVIVKLGDRSEEYKVPVLWNRKPRSLHDPESAIEMLKLIGKKDDADRLLDEPDEEYYHVLSDYWKKFDSDTSHAFNEVFAEFYSRIDYANKNFKSLNGDLGAKSDRGIIYLKFGKPDSTERTYNEKYNIIEIWEYKSLGKKIYFSDKTGTGNFIRIK